MSISPFVFSSENLPRLKAKQLVKIFPFLKLSVAQEATARALGYSSWYECIHKGALGEPSLSDQEAGLHVRVVRYYHQAGVLMGLGITPSDADRWVRAWGLTGHPTLASVYAVPLYFRWHENLARLERGEISEDHAREEWEDMWSKYPDIDRPQDVCPGVILGPCGRYPHYAVHPVINAQIPIYLRGPHSLYHYEDNGGVLAMTIRGFPKESWHEEPSLNFPQHEWHYGVKHPESDELVVPGLVAAAMAAPDSIVIISQRSKPIPNGGYENDRLALACLRGRDFATFLQSKGVLDTTKVIWYQNIRADIGGLIRNWSGRDFHEDGDLPIFTDADKHKPSLPLYSYPFMTAPMHDEEYRVGTMERTCLLPLNEDHSDDEDDDNWNNGDPDPLPPASPEMEKIISALRQAAYE